MDMTTGSSKIAKNDCKAEDILLIILPENNLCLYFIIILLTIGFIIFI